MRWSPADGAALSGEDERELFVMLLEYHDGLRRAEALAVEAHGRASDSYGRAGLRGTAAAITGAIRDGDLALSNLVGRWEE